ncbi:MAG: PAS domain S-box protein [Candidatus Heimdallarchaeota archaeon]
MQNKKKALEGGNISKNPRDDLTIFDDQEIVLWANAFRDILDIRISLIDSNKELIFTTDNSVDVIGYSLEDFKLLTIFGYIHPDDREKVRLNFNDFNDNNISNPLVYRIFKPNGEMRWIRGIAQKFLNNETKTEIGTTIVEFDVTDQIKPNEFDSEEGIFRTLIELIRTPILFMKNNQIYWTSKNWQKFFGYTHNEVKNNSIEFLFKNQDCFAKFLFDCNKILKIEGELLHQAEFVTKKKVSHLFDVRIYTIDKNNLSKGVLLFFVDVTQENSINQTKDETIDFYENIVENFETIILRIENKKIIWVNKLVQSILQYKTDELIGMNLDILFQTKDALKELINEINKAFLDNRNFVSEITCIRKDRMPLSFLARATNVSYEEKLCYILVLDPVSDLRQLINELRDEKSELEFYSDLLFHDVKNLCQDALSQIDLSLLRMETNPSESESRQRKSMIEILRIAELITNVDKFFKIKRKGYEIQSYDIRKSLERAIEKIQTKFDHKKVTISHNLKSGRFFTLGNELLDDAFFNIFDNAVMYDRNPEVIIDFQISTSDNIDGYWKIEFLDNGPGIGNEMKKFLFDRFARSKGTIHGSGFGLTLVKAIIESFNGHISVKDKDEKNRSKGSIFIIEIPKAVS